MLAVELKLDPDETLDRVSDFAGRLADHASTVKKQMMSEGLNHPVIPRLADAVAKRSATSRKMMQTV